MPALLGSTPRPVLPSVTWAAFRLLIQQPLARPEIEDLLLPRSLRTDGGRPESVTAALDVLEDLGVLITRDDRLCVDPGVGRDDLSERAFQAELRQRVLAVDRNESLLESDEGTRELTKALAWFLAQSVDVPPTSYNRTSSEASSVTQLLNEQFSSDEGAKAILQNSYRWVPFVRWARYLGFMSFLPIKDGGPCPDPTNAIRDALPALGATLPGETELPHFVAGLAKMLPVLDGGSYRQQVEGMMDNKPVSSGGPDTLSASLSLALLRLKDVGAIDLQRASDSPATRSLCVRAGHRLPFSHVQILSLVESAAA